LWTDAFAVCNFLGLARGTGETRYTVLALELIDAVHHTLGQHRPDEAQRGWLSGLVGEEGEAHPTRGGLRIGKPHSERRREEPFDEALEWERDGQYFHYLTQWMHALNQAARATGRPELNRWARELAETAHRRFVYGADGHERMYWKMSIDLAWPLVPSMGQHDALDGYVECAELAASATRLKERGPMLDDEARSFASMIDRSRLATADPLGLGALLVDADRLDQLARLATSVDARLEDALVRAALVGLAEYARQGELGRPAEHRLAFRELGLAIGLEAAAALRSRSPTLVEELARYDWLRIEILSFWLAAAHQAARSFREHRDINEVMLATGLLPDGFLRLAIEH
jgi:hypothetical protein